MLSSNDYVSEEDLIFKATSVGGSHPRPVFFGHRLMDSAIPGGMSPWIPGIHLIQGPTGSRKTTFAMNMVLNMHLSPSIPPGFTTYWWSSDSLMTQEHVMAFMRVMLSAKIMIHSEYNGFSCYKDAEFLAKHALDMNAGKYFAECKSILKKTSDLILKSAPIPASPMDTLFPMKRDLVFSADFLKSCYMFPDDYAMTSLMRSAWLVAGFCMKSIRFVTFGTSEHHDKKIREERHFDSDNLELSGKRWLELVDEADGNCQFVIDHVTAFELGGASEYEKQKAVKPHLKNILKKYPILEWVIIQDGVGNQRDKLRLGYSIGAAGGDVLGQESNINWQKRRYDKENTPQWDVLERPMKSRRGEHPALAFMIAPHSGAYFGQAQMASKAMP